MKSYFTIEQNCDKDKNLTKKILNLDIEWQEAKEDWIIKKGKFQEISITVYKKGKILLQGKDIGSFLELLGYEEQVQRNVIGVDESGKGDYFGPLVTAAVYIKDSSKLNDLGIRDSKQLSNKKVIEISHEIKKLCEVKVSTLMPKEYNEKYEQEKNLNVLLAKQHVMNIKELCKNEVDTIYIDKFASRSNIGKMLNAEIKIVEETKAEDKYIAVAAASIIARASFLVALERMSKKINIELPKGAYNVEETGIIVLEKYGFEGLKKLAKIHFKTTDKLLKII